MFDVRTKGRAPKDVEVSVIGEVTEADLRLLATTTKGVKPDVVKRLSGRHHSLARLIASGMSQGDAAIMSGYALSRVSILMNDPTFMELLDYYRRISEDSYKDMHDSLATLARDAVEELRDRIETRPEEITTGALIEIVKTGADRTGFGPKTTQVNVHVGVAERLRAARQRAQEAKELPNIVDAEIVE